MARTLSDRWNHVRTQFALKDLVLDVSGKILAALGLGALLAQWLTPCAWWLIAVGLALSVTVKAKYWNRFWAS